MNGPFGEAYDETNKRLFVADSYNNRVLVFDVNAITDGEMRRTDGYVDTYYRIIRNIAPLPVYAFCRAFIAALEHVPARLHSIGQQMRHEATGEPNRVWIMVNARCSSSLEMSVAALSRSCPGLAAPMRPWPRLACIAIQKLLTGSSMAWPLTGSSAADGMSMGQR